MSSPIRSAATRALDLLDGLVGFLAVVCLLAIVGDVLAGVISRYVFNDSFSWTEEVGRWLYGYLIFLGVTLAHRRRQHIALALLDQLLHPSLRAPRAFVVELIVAYTTIHLLFSSYELMTLVGGVNVMLKLSNWIRYTVIPVTCAVGLVYLALRGIEEGRSLLFSVGAVVFAGIAFAGTSQGLVSLPQGSPSEYMGVAFLGSLILGVPVAFSILFSAFVANLGGNLLPPAAVVQTMVNGSSQFLLLAIPLFIAASHVMNIGGLSMRLVEFARQCVGNARGGLAQVNVLTSLLFGGLSGSSGADTALNSKIIVPEMVRHGYSGAFSCAITSASAVLPNIIPPSISMLVFAAIAEVSVVKLFLSGIVPGIVLAGLLMMTVFVVATRKGYGRSGVKATVRKVLGSLVVALPVLSLAVVIVGGIRFGVVTPTEAGVVAVVYAFFLGKIIYRGFDWITLYTQLKSIAVEAAIIGFLIGVAAPFAYVLISEQIPQSFVSFVLRFTDSPESILLAVVIIGLFAGTFLDLTASMLILVPLVLPLLVQVGVDPVHFGLVLVVTLMMGGLTPPVGILVFISASITGTSAGAVFRQVLPFLAVMILGLLLFTFVPAVPMALVWWLT